MGDVPSHYFDAQPDVVSRPKTVTLNLPDRTLVLRTDRGVFAGNGVDPGTKQLLLDAPEPPERGTFVDLGCGYGPIACTLAARRPESPVWAVDVNERALDLCRRNAEDLGLRNVRVVSGDDLPEDLGVDLIWSNPPIRIGKAALHQLLVGWLRRLTPMGSAVLVVQKHLGSDSLQRWLDSEGWETERLSSRAGYRLLEVRPR
jgi:16S rRNA (guanine1207-N2)-methyltransferase